MNDRHPMGTQQDSSTEIQEDRWIIIGLGNDCICDDGLGIHAVRALKEIVGNANQPGSLRRCDNLDNAVIRESTAGGLELLDYMVGYRKCILLDAVVTGTNPPGTIYRHLFRHDDEPVRISSTHQMNIPDLFGLGKLLHFAMPSHVIIYGMEVVDVTTFSPQCTPTIERMLPQFIEAVVGELLSGGNCRSTGAYQVTEFPRWCFGQGHPAGSYQIFESHKV